MSESHTSRRWAAYYEKNKERSLRALYVRAKTLLNSGTEVQLNFEDEPMIAVDIGCGTGHEAIDLLSSGFEVHALDSETIAIDKLVENAKIAGLDNRLKVHKIEIEKFCEWPKAHFICAFHSFPFCKQGQFANSINSALQSVKKGGYFVASFFGSEDDFVINGGLTPMTKRGLEKVLAKNGFEISFIDESKKMGLSALDGEKFWHILEVIAKKSEISE